VVAVHPWPAREKSLPKQTKPPEEPDEEEMALGDHEEAQVAAAAMESSWKKRATAPPMLPAPPPSLPRWIQVLAGLFYRAMAAMGSWASTSRLGSALRRWAARPGGSLGGAD